MNFITDYDYTVSSFEKKVGLPNATLSNAKKRGSDITTDVVESISNVMRDELEAAGYVIMDMRPIGRQELAILSPEDAKHIISNLGRGELCDIEESEDKISIRTLSQAVADQANASKIQASANHKYAEGFSALARVLENIESKMARETTQAILAAKNEEALAILDKLSIGQNGGLKKIFDEFAVLRGQISGLKTADKQRR